MAERDMGRWIKSGKLTHDSLEQIMRLENRQDETSIQDMSKEQMAKALQVAKLLTYDADDVLARVDDDPNSDCPKGIVEARKEISGIANQTARLPLERKEAEPPSTTSYLVYWGAAVLAIFVMMAFTS